MNKLKIVLIVLVVLLFGGYFGFWYYADHKLEGAPRMSVYDYAENPIIAAKGVANRAYQILEFIQYCKKYPNSLKEFKEMHVHPDGCKLKKFVPDETQVDINSPVYPWNDPWGRPYQIRYDLERAKLQVRSRGRYLWWPWDDVVGETYFNGKSYKAQVEYCKTVPEDDMSCIFNRGWH